MNLDAIKEEMSKVEYVEENINYPCVRIRKVVRVSNAALSCSGDLIGELKYQRDKLVVEATRDAVKILSGKNYDKYTSALVGVQVIKDVDSRHNVVSEILIVEVGGS